MLIQPLEAYHYFAANAKLTSGKYAYERYPEAFQFKKLPILYDEITHTYSSAKMGIYVAPYWYNIFYNETDEATFNDYTLYRLMAYEHDRTFDAVAALKIPDSFQPFDESSSELKVLDYKSNELTVKTDFPTPKLLVYNDSYDPNWRVVIDGQPSELKRVNIAFKGVWVPAGVHQVRFVYGKPWYYFLNAAVLFMCMALLMVIVYLRFGPKVKRI